MQPDSVLKLWHTEGCQKLHDGFFNFARNLNGILILFAGLSPRLFEVCTSLFAFDFAFFAFDFDAREDDCPFDCCAPYRSPDTGARRELPASPR